MKKFLVMCLMASFMGLAGASLVTFDDLSANLNSGGMLYGGIPLNYQGFEWRPENVQSSWNVNNGNTYKSVYNNSYGAVSSDNFASNSGAAVVSVSGEVFDFLGAWFSPWEQGNAMKSWSAGYVTAKGYLEGALVGQKTLTMSGQGFEWFEVDFAGIDKVEFCTSSGKYWIMDDFTTAEKSEIVIPEPATMVLLGLGGVLLRKRG